ncbi:hypothetical protein CXB51_020225 [Gossypium anomalum]|uniref:Uncharacterized protein n=1 Tax=Gossypium anomalum TaxID=47600 RepID=A0A8J5YNL4_9ROSI|nr:hypothetical protein CXB51_020225 [Gossypium anomalum]
MRTPSPFLPLVILAIVLATLHTSSCRQITGPPYHQTQPNLRSKYEAVHGVSHLLVPGGPNPLHN